MLKAKGILQPMILATLLATGFAILWSILASWTQAVSRDRREYVGLQQLHFLLDGTPVIRTDDGGRDLTGKFIRGGKSKTMTTTDIFLGSGIDQPDAPPAAWEQRLRTFSDSSQPSAVWYFVSDGRPHGFAYLVGYDLKTNARVGFIGKTGFRQDEPPIQERFPFANGGVADLHNSAITRRLLSPQGYLDPTDGVSYVNPADEVRYGVLRTGGAGSFEYSLVFVQADNDKIYEIDLNQRVVRVVLENRQIRSMWWNFEPPDSSACGLAVRTENAVLLLNQSLEVVKEIPLPAELRGQSIFWAQTSVGTYLAWTTDALRLGWTGYKYDVYWLNEAGQVSRHEEINLPHEAADHYGYWMGIIVPAPLPLSVVEYIALPLTTTGTWSEAWAYTLEDYRPSLPLACLVGAVLAFLCYRREKRYGASRTERFFWPLFVFAFGLGGWIGYRFGRSWPSLVRCPTCRAAVPCDHVACTACQAEFPLPALKGTEVFA